MIKRYLIVGAMTALIALIAACGGGSDDSSGSTASTAAPAATTAPAATAIPAGPSNSELVALGEKEFGTCAGCHGADATGVTGLGKSLVGSDFITNISDSDLATLIKTGRPSSDPANTTGIDMPPKGGNPALNDDKIDGLVAYIRSIQ
ncbi:MAG: c-type cytochrome [Chloroflexi bacterium]|nr:c-type cytochrome [Chloroflexota bacterium]